jgi:hypothetical protein
MDFNEIIEMAREAGWKDLRDYDSQMREDIFMGSTGSLEAFAKLVAAKEREECAKVCDELHHTDPEYYQFEEPTASECADAIRALK